MRQQHIATIGFAGVILATPASAAKPGWVEYAEWSVLTAADALAAGYRAAPALMLGLVSLIAVPLAAAAAGFWRWRQRRLGARADVPQQAAEGPTPQALHASLEVVGKDGPRVEILNEMLRIGREEDNDIRIRSKRVHRYHAAIHREDFGIYRITDLAGGEGNGLSVNGQPCDEAQLKDGDVIELGPGRLRFHAGLV